MRRRDLITLLGGAVAWPLAAHAQSDRIRRVGVLMVAEGDEVAQSQVAAFRQGLEKGGWTEGRNIRIDVRFAGGDPNRIQSSATELARLNPEVVFAQSSVAVTALLRENHSLPIVFVQIGDPVGSGYVASLARPGGNITGFTPEEFSMGAKRLEVLKDVAPHIRHVSVLFNPDQVPGVMTWRAIEAAAPSVAIRAVAAGIHEAAEIKPAVEACASEANGGLIVLASAPTLVYRGEIIELAARHRLPAVYNYSFHAREGGLVSYGVDLTEQYRQAGSYVDRILKGTKPGDLPIQQPTKFELVVNLTTAKALGLTIPRDFLLRADEVIE
jgi:putative tryptophan/tyrosine transport system substrate-binding protein